MLAPVLIFLACMSVGVICGARWLPDLAVERVAGLAFFVVCGILGAALGLAGVHVYLIVEGLDHYGGTTSRGEIVAAGLRALIYETGSLVGLAAVIYLLAPFAEEDEEPQAPSNA